MILLVDFFEINLCKLLIMVFKTKPLVRFKRFLCLSNGKAASLYLKIVASIFLSYKMVS